MAAAAAVDSAGDGVAGADLRGAVVVAGEVPDAVETALGRGSSLDASIDGSIIGATHMPEYAESIGAVAHEPVASMSNRAGSAASSDGGSNFASAAREPVVVVSAVAASSAFREPLALIEESSEAATPLRMPLGESDVGAAGALRTPLGESDAMPAGSLCRPLGES